MDKTLTGIQPAGSPAARQPLAAEGTRSVRLSERDEAAVLAAADKPPAPNEAALQAARRFIRRHEEKRRPFTPS